MREKAMQRSYRRRVLPFLPIRATLQRKRRRRPEEFGWSAVHGKRGLFLKMSKQDFYRITGDEIV